MGERAYRCVTGAIRIPHHPPARRSWQVEDQIREIPLEGISGLELSSEPVSSDAFRMWWEPLTIGAQAWASHYIGDLVPGSLLMRDWVQCVWEPSHAYQIGHLSDQVEALTMHIRELGGDPAGVYAAWWANRQADGAEANESQSGRYPDVAGPSHQYRMGPSSSTEDFIEDALDLG